MPATTQKNFAAIAVTLVFIPIGVFVSLASRGKIPQVDGTTLPGAFAFATGLIVFVCSRYEWYWDTFYTGYYRHWNTKGGRAWNSMVCVGLMLLGLALLTGLIKG